MVLGFKLEKFLRKNKINGWFPYGILWLLLGLDFAATRDGILIGFNGRNGFWWWVLVFYNGGSWCYLWLPLIGFYGESSSSVPMVVATMAAACFRSFLLLLFSFSFDRNLGMTK